MYRNPELRSCVWSIETAAGPDFLTEKGGALSGVHSIATGEKKKKMQKKLMLFCAIAIWGIECIGRYENQGRQ